MADMTATQREALSGMNLSDHEKRMKELEAELEAVKARIAETKANIANLKADKKLIESAQPAKEEIPFAPDRGLTGIRDEDGTLVTAKDQEARLNAQKAAGIEREQEIYEDMYSKKGSKFSQDEINQMSTEEMIEAGIPVQQSKVLVVDDDTEAEESWLERTQRLTQEAIERQEEAKIAGIEQEQEIYEEMYPEGEEVVQEEEVVEDDSPLKVRVDLDPDNWLDKDKTTDEESSKKRFKGSQSVESVTRDDGSELEMGGGRAYAEESEVRSEKPGWEAKEGSNTWSINEKDDYWKTKEGYDEAVALYGSKPAWVKEPTLVWNPAEQKYEEIEEEEFVDLKPYKKRISL